MVLHVAKQQPADPPLDRLDAAPTSLAPDVIACSRGDVVFTLDVVNIEENSR